MPQNTLEKYSWLNNNFFELALRKYKSDAFLKTFLIKHELTQRNLSYWCDIIKFELNYTDVGNESKSENVLLKIAYFNAYMEESMEKYSPFKRELFFYQDIVPKIKELLLSVGDSGDLVESAISIVNERPQPKYLLLRDFSEEKFFKVNHRSGLDLQHLKLSVENLAKFHATSAVLNSTESEIFGNHQQPNVSEYFKVFHSLFSNCVKALMETSEENAVKLSAFERNMIDKVSEAFMLKDDDFGVLCHGDLWMNNLIFAYDSSNSKPIDVKMIDFGLSYFGSPAVDLTYLLFTSSSDEIRDFEFDVLLQTYHKKLHENLIKMNYSLPIPTLIQIHNYFLRCGVIGVLYTTLLLPMRYANSSRDLKAFVENSKEGVDTRKELFSDGALRERIEFLLNYFDRKGFLD